MYRILSPHAPESSETLATCPFVISFLAATSPPDDDGACEPTRIPVPKRRFDTFYRTRALPSRYTRRRDVETSTRYRTSEKLASGPPGPLGVARPRRRVPAAYVSRVPPPRTDGPFSIDFSAEPDSPP